ncbi:Envelope glycoprotein [Phytophthora pseudosyringae]|uniref:Envelope glycoprotein n=1 Tax=Phytophthora pseudosyringae TaxID=221518 RepID=A0A8T1W2C1_9STRA|nr:Envelope glycoprotein [Phytophthora pseudosyringae]
MRSFFRLLKDIKHTVRRASTNSRGYVEHELTKNKTDCKHLRLGNEWVIEETLPGFRNEMATYFSKMEYAAHRLLKVFTVALGEEPTFFDQFFLDDNSSRTRLNHYPATEDLEKTMGVTTTHTLAL